jgi:hypothetical protein
MYMAGSETTGVTAAQWPELKLQQPHPTGAAEFSRQWYVCLEKLMNVPLNMRSVWPKRLNMT